MFEEKRVLVTGALGGIGFAVARRFAEAGASLILVDREEADAERVAMLRTSGAAAVTSHGCNVGDVAAVGAVLASVGRIDVLVNVAGVMIYKPIEALEADDWQRILAINFISAALFTGHALRTMPPGGAIINIASVHARRTSALVAPYAASKAALASLTRSTAIEGREKGIRCNAILPGAIDTPMLAASPNIRSGAEVIDPADVGRPEDVADLACFLASDGARFISGEEIVADGGRMGRL